MAKHERKCQKMSKMTKKKKKTKHGRKKAKTWQTNISKLKKIQKSKIKNSSPAGLQFVFVCVCFSFSLSFSLSLSFFLSFLSFFFSSFFLFLLFSIFHLFVLIFLFFSIVFFFLFFALYIFLFHHFFIFLIFFMFLFCSFFGWCCVGACLLSSVRRCCLVSSFFGWCCVSPLLSRGAAWFPPSFWMVLLFFLFLLVVLPSFSSLGWDFVFHLLCWVVLLGLLLPWRCFPFLLRGAVSPVWWCSRPSPPLGSGAFLLSSVGWCCLVSSSSFWWFLLFFLLLLVLLPSSSFRCGSVLHLFCWVVLLGLLLSLEWCCCFSFSLCVVLPSFSSSGWQSRWLWQRRRTTPHEDRSLPQSSGRWRSKLRTSERSGILPEPLPQRSDRSRRHFSGDGLPQLAVPSLAGAAGEAVDAAALAFLLSQSLAAKEHEDRKKREEEA